MVNTDSSIEEEIKERIAAGNRTYRVHKKDQPRGLVVRVSDY